MFVCILWIVYFEVFKSRKLRHIQRKHILLGKLFEKKTFILFNINDMCTCYGTFTESHLCALFKLKVLQKPFQLRRPSPCKIKKQTFTRPSVAINQESATLLEDKLVRMGDNLPDPDSSPSDSSPSRTWLAFLRHRVIAHTEQLRQKKQSQQNRAKLLLK